jgi:hypothetical protein
MRAGLPGRLNSPNSQPVEESRWTHPLFPPWIRKTHCTKKRGAEKDRRTNRSVATFLEMQASHLQSKTTATTATCTTRQETQSERWKQERKGGTASIADAALAGASSSWASTSGWIGAGGSWCRSKGSRRGRWRRRGSFDDSQGLMYPCWPPRPSTRAWRWMPCAL